MVFSLCITSGVVDDELIKSEGEDDNINDDAVVVDDGTRESSGNTDFKSEKEFFLSEEELQLVKCDFFKLLF